MKAGGLDGGIGLGESFRGNGVLLGDLIKGFPLLHCVGGRRINGKRKSEKQQAGGKDLADAHLSAIALSGRVADPFCRIYRAGRGLAKGSVGGRTEYLRQCSSAW